MAKKAQNTPVEKSIEDRIWESANKLRGSLDASEYRNVVLGLIFLKYISDCFDHRHQELVEEGEGFEEDKDEYTAEHVFWVPEVARWSIIVNDAHNATNGKTIDTAMEAIEKENPRLKNILPKNYAREEIDKIRLGEVIDVFNNVQMYEHGSEMDIFGRVYEYCLGQFASEMKQKGGEFYTPSCIVRTLVEVLQPFNGRVYDGACGSAGMFVQSAKFVKHHSGDLRKMSVFGQEFVANTWKMAQMNLAIRGIDGDLGPSWGDTFGNDYHADKKFDFCMMNPPFNQSDWGAERLAEDVRWKYGLPPANNANFAWIQHMIHHMSPKGKIGLVLANGSLSSQSGGEGDIRQKIVEDDLVEGIVALPGQLFFSVQIPVCLWFFNKQKKQKGKVLFIDARNMGYMVDRTHKELSDDECRYDFIKKQDKPWKDVAAEECDIQKIASTFRAFENGTLEDQKGFCAVVDMKEIEKQDFILTPGRYVGIADVEDDGISFAEKMATATKELSELLAKGHDLEDEIRKQLKSIGWEV